MTSSADRAFGKRAELKRRRFVQLRELFSVASFYALPELFRPISAQSAVVNEEFIRSGLDRAYFAIAVIPEASSMLDTRTGKKWDSVRALLVFDKNQFMYMLHSEINTVFDPVDPASLTNEDLEAARKPMQRLRESIRFQ